MSANTKIEWTDHTFNPWWGCQKVGPGCDHCYAETLDKRTGGEHWGPGAARRRTSVKNWNDPERWNKKADAFFAEHGRRQSVFCASMADVFDNSVDSQWRADLFALIRATPNLDWLLLTKRIGNVDAMVEAAGGWPANAKLGITVVDQKEADRDIQKALKVKGKYEIRVLFLSMEPLLGPVDISRFVDPTGVHCIDVCPDSRYVKESEVETFNNGHELVPLCPHCGLDASWTGYDEGIDWVIVGGESGPMHPDWARSLRDQCEAAGVPFLFKQWGEWKPISQMAEAEHGALYKSKVKAEPHEDQSNLDDIYGRKCTVPTTVIHLDGSTHSFAEPMAFLQGTEAMQIFKVGKKAAGRQLDGRTWDGFSS